jgi:hypothetical protein
MKNTIVCFLVSISFLYSAQCQLGGLNKLKDKAKSAIKEPSKAETKSNSNGEYIKSEESVFNIKKVDMTTLEEAPEGTFKPGGLFIGAGYPYMNNTKGMIMKSSDGRRWEELFTNGEATCASVAYGEGKLVAVGDQQILVTTNGSDWKRISTTINHQFFGGFEDVCYGNGMFVAVGTQSLLVWSKDGETWVSFPGQTVDPDTRAASTHLYGVDFIEGKFYVTGNRNRVMILVPDEKDGIYIEKNINQDQIMSRLNEMVYGNGKYIAVGTKQDYISTDGQNWNVNAPEWQNWGAIYADGKFVKVCGFGRIFTSTSGESNSWKETLYAMRTMLWDIAYGNGKYVVTGKDGILYTSIDAENWESGSISPSHTLKKLIYIP